MASAVFHKLKCMLECFSRAIIIAQPTDVEEFGRQYFLELAEFGKTMPGLDQAEVAFHFEEKWEIDFLTRSHDKRVQKPSTAPPPSSTTWQQKPRPPPLKKKPQGYVQTDNRRPRSQVPEKMVTSKQNLKPKPKPTNEPQESAKGKLNRTPGHANAKETDRKNQTSSKAPIKSKPPSAKAPVKSKPPSAKAPVKSKPPSAKAPVKSKPLSAKVPVKSKPPCGTRPKVKDEGTKQSKSKKTTQHEEKAKKETPAAENRGNRVLWIDRERVKPILGGRDGCPLRPGVYIPDPDQPPILIHYRLQWTDDHSHRH
ncbi:pollen-specific leucine-rich repeat extensin-like protein 1 [Fundulus heteroclitus]|uniref:pollen-specific leucine-rich repeat extensin-like protein 1 n=1 Tax=Fundulus heteroclitus TaxID=8078 RepID=UPI00165AA0ED|nr:pollen-specific leucine-rich repeat extensin-like protein 1 [Fundulus heteroclitus]